MVFERDPACKGFVQPFLYFKGDHYGNFTDKFGVQWAINSPRAK